MCACRPSNTCRYRLARAEQIAGLTLGDPDERLLLWLQLRFGLGASGRAIA
jgi:DNA-binding PucR family transcriptional regulator